MDVKTLVGVFFVSLFLSACAPQKASDQVFKDNSLQKTAGGNCSSSVIRNQFLVRWKNGKVTKETAQNLEEFKSEFLEKHSSDISFAEYDVRVQIEQPTVTQQSVILQQNVDTWGQDLIEASSAWSAGYRGQNVLVGIVDTQVEFNHPQLNDRSYQTNSPQGDSYGRGNFTNARYCIPAGDENCAQHGTHVAGIIAATHGTGPVKGIAPASKIIAAGFLGVDGSGTLGDAVLALQYVEARGAKIINASWGAPNCSDTVREEFLRLENKGILLVVAAGNGDRYGGFDIFQYPVTPASFNLSTQISVAASTQFDFQTAFSNFSFSLVHMAAPGEFIYSTIPTDHGSYASFSGTSMAAPFVSGAAAVLWSARPEATAQQIRKALLESVDVTPGHEFEVLTRGRLNLRKALQKILAL